MEFNFKLPTYSIAASVWGNFAAHWKAMSYENTTTGKVAHFFIGLITLIPGLGLIEMGLVKALGDTHKVEVGLSSQNKKTWLDFFRQNEENFQFLLSLTPQQQQDEGASLPSLTPAQKNLFELFLAHLSEIRQLSREDMEKLPPSTKKAFESVRKKQFRETDLKWIMAVRELYPEWDCISLNKLPAEMHKKWARVVQVLNHPTTLESVDLTKEDRVLIFDLVKNAANAAPSNASSFELIRKLAHPKDIEERMEALKFFSRLGPVSLSIEDHGFLQPSLDRTYENIVVDIEFDVNRNEFLFVDGRKVDKNNLPYIKTYLQSKMKNFSDERLNNILDLCYQRFFGHQFTYSERNFTTGVNSEGEYDPPLFPSCKKMKMEVKTGNEPKIIGTGFYKCGKGFFIKAVSTFDLITEKLEMVYEVVKVPEGVDEKVWLNAQVSKKDVFVPRLPKRHLEP